MNIRKYLKKNNMTTGQLAESLGVHPSYMRGILCGSKQMPSNMMIKIFEMTQGEVTLDELKNHQENQLKLRRLKDEY